jgi:molybdopterin molybdotransferase
VITVQEATHIILSHAPQWETIEVPLQKANGRILAEPLKADRDFPPFTRVSMDGIAIRFDSFESGRRTFPIQGIQAAGQPQLTLEDPSHCLEVMTGAVLPENTDTVIRYEDLEIEDGKATIVIDDIRSGQNAHPQGSDREAGSLIVPAGQLITPAEVGVAATVGRSVLKVLRHPKALLVSTGDELVNINQTPLPHQIRKSNVFTIQAMLRQWGIKSDLLHLLDDKEDIRNKLSQALKENDLLIMSGGVSMGKFDYLPELLIELGVEKHFHKVEQRPGKPFWFGTTPQGTAVFALPGNPVSTFVGTQRYVQSWLRCSWGLNPLPLEFAELEEDFHFRPNLTYFLQVKLSCSREGKWMARPVTGKGSGDLANLVDADGFLELPQGRNEFHAGEVFPVIRYRSGS